MNSVRSLSHLLCFAGLVVFPVAGVRALTVAQTGTPVSGAVRNSMAMVEGRPAIVWSDRTILKYARALDATGTAWGEPVIVDPGTSGLGVYVMLRVVNGRPAVSIFNFSQGLTLIRAADSTGSEWNAPVSVSGNVTMQTNMEVVDGHPAVAFRLAGTGVAYMRATDPDGTAWGPVVIADPHPDAVFHSLKVVQGRPAIACADSSGLWYVRAVDAAGTLWLPPVNAAPGTGVIHCSMQVINGHPAISFSTGSETLSYVRATDPEGTAWSVPVTPDPVGLTGIQSSLAAVNGKPAIAYHSSGPLNDLRYLQAKDSDGDTPDSWNAPLTLESSDITGEYPSLLEVNGWPAVTYFDVSQSSLKYLRATNPGDGTIWPVELILTQNGIPIAAGGIMDCGPLEPGEMKTLDVFIKNLNFSGGTLNIQGLTIDGPDAAEFSIIVPPVSPVPGGGQSMFTLRYAPDTPGIKMATLHLTTDAANELSPYDINLTADSAPAVAVEWPAGTALEDGGSLFLPIAAAGSINDLTFTVRNPGGAKLNGLALTIDGPHSSEYSVATAPASVVVPGDSTTFTLRHAPLTTGGKIASFHLASNVAGNRNPFDFIVKRMAGLRDESFRALTDGDVLSIAVRANGTILTASSGVLEAFNPDGSPDNTFFSPALLGGPVTCIALQKDGRILIGGDFTRVDGRARTGFARLLGDGSLDDSFLPAIPYALNCIAVQPDGKILGGTAPNAAAAVQPWLVRFHPDGSRDTPFAPRLNFPVEYLALQPDGRILMGGWFNTVNETATGGLARLHADGTLDETFARGQPIGVRSLALQPDGRIWAAGNFSGGIARLFPDGIRDPSMVLNCDDTAGDIVLQTDGKCLVTGAFDTIGGVVRHHLARINPDGTLDATFEAAMEGNVIRRLALQPDGGVLLGGDFTIAGGVPQSKLTRLGNEPAVTSFQMSGNATVRWLRSGAAPEVSDVSFDLKPAGSADWTPLGSAHRIPGGWDLTGLTPPASGSLRARGLAGGSLMESVMFPLTSLESWRMQYFHTAANTGNSADSADPDFDGLTNLVEFAFALSPVNGGSNALPAFIHDGTSLTASFTAPPGSEDTILHSGEWSSSMLPGTWTVIPDTGTGGRRHMFTVPGEAGRVFVRFVVRAK